MNSTHAGSFAAASMAGLALCVVLSGCAPQPAASGADPRAAVSSAAERMSTLTVPPASDSPTAAATAPASSSVPASPAPPAKKESPALRTYTFPDGHISFAYPAAWTVRTVLPPAGLPGVEAIVADSSGNDLLSLSNGVTAGCTGGPVARWVFDQEAVPGMQAPGAAEPSFGFVVESANNGDAYHMGLADSRSLKQGGGVASWCSLVPTANGGLFSRVLFEDPGFPDRGAARAWMATEQYAQLKALLISLSYT